MAMQHRAAEAFPEARDDGPGVERNVRASSSIFSAAENARTTCHGAEDPGQSTTRPFLGVILKVRRRITLGSSVTGCSHTKSLPPRILGWRVGKRRMTSPPLEFNADGSAKDLVAFRAFIQQDAAKLAVIKTDPEVAAVVLGDDDEALQEMLRGLFKVKGSNSEAVAINCSPNPSCDHKINSLSIVGLPVGRRRGECCRMR